MREAYDSDGVVAIVDFYSNSNLVGSDNSSPFEIDFDLNRTGLYELRAVARDNSGNWLLPM